MQKEKLYGPVYSVLPCTDPSQGALITCNGFPYLRTAFEDIPADEHTEMAHEIILELSGTAT
jgi:hypothetical protein